MRRFCALICQLQTLLIPVVFIAAVSLVSAAQTPAPVLVATVDGAVPTTPATPVEEDASPIQDNSFLIEEAYNQEYGVVQHISTFTRLWSSKDWAYSFTQEWPGLTNWRHQFSYTLVAARPGAFATDGPGFGDVMLNYRYQVLGSGDTRVAIAPRVSLIAPSGNSRLGRGVGGWGTQINLPVSVVMNRHFVTHWNAGTTIVPSAKNFLGDSAFSSSYMVGESTIWLAAPRFNVMFETVWNSAQAVVARDRTEEVHSLLLNPGIRWAYNFKNGLQIVPGVSVPFGVGPSYGEKGVFLYLSFEHPFKKGHTE